jgi:hypothetical protein
VKLKRTMNLSSIKILAIAFLIVAYIVTPLIVIQIIPTDSPQPYVSKVAIVDKLDETLNGKLQYYLVEHVEGSSPSQEFVITMDVPYSRGMEKVSLDPGQSVWVQGSLMSREGFYGEHYLFFDKPQIYVRQAKQALLWPDQVTELKILYTSPIGLLVGFSLILVTGNWLREGNPLINSLVIIEYVGFFLTTAILLIKNRKNRTNLALILLGYAWLAVLLAIPGLTNSY